MTDNSLEKTVVSELIRGPVSNEYQRTIPSGAQLISVETTEGVCFVNFSGGFSFKSEEEKFVEKAAVYSVVNSLTRLPNIEKVQILIDGKKPENDTLQLYSTPLERNEEMIESAK
jgi:spore germination protein GerM